MKNIKIKEEITITELFLLKEYYDNLISKHCFDEDQSKADSFRATKLVLCSMLSNFVERITTEENNYDIYMNAMYEYKRRRQ